MASLGLPPQHGSLWESDSFQPWLASSRVFPETKAESSLQLAWEVKLLPQLTEANPDVKGG